MKGDFSRWRTGAGRNFNGVLPQQGKVLLDADGITQTMLANDWQQTAGRDVIGACAAVPQTEPNSFLVTNAALPAGGGVTLTVDTGHVWADGLLVRLHGSAGATNVTRTATWLEPPIVPTEGSAGDVAAGTIDTVVLEVWQRAANGFALPDALIEPALGGPDTAERLQTECAFRLARLTAGQTCSSVTYDESSRGTLIAMLVDTVTTGGDCPVLATGGYSGFEHQLYRIEIADTGKAFAQFKWSRINAGLCGRGTFNAINQQIAIDANLAAINSYNQTDFYVEIEAEDPQLGYTRVIAGAHATLNAGVLQLDATANFPASGAYPASGEVFFRLWDGIDALSAFPVVTSPTNPTQLENGILLQFEAGASVSYLPGDYWMFPVRAQGITNPQTLINGEQPQGIRYHRVPLAEITWASDGAGGFVAQTIQDCRRPIHPVTEPSCCCTYRVGDGVDSFGDFTSIQAAVDALPATGGEICILPGLYFENVIISQVRDVVIHGCGWQTRVASASLGPNGANAVPVYAGPQQKAAGMAAVFTVAASAHVQFRSFCIEAAQTEAGILLDGVDILTPSNPAPGRFNQRKDATGTFGNSNFLRFGVFDTAIEDMVITGAQAPGIMAVRATQLLVKHNRVLMANTQSNWPAAFFSGRQIFIEQNVFTLLSISTTRNLVPVTVQNDLASFPSSPSSSSTSTSGFFNAFEHPGGIQIGGPSTLVFVTENEIIGGSRLGISLGSIVVLDANGGETGGWWGVVVGGGDNCCTGGIIITGGGPGNGQTYGNAGPLTEIWIERNLITEMGLCGIGPVAYFGADQYEVITVETLTIVGNTIISTITRAIDTSTATATSFLTGLGAITLADAANVTIRDNVIQDFGQNAGEQVSGIFIVLGQGIEISRNQIKETRDWDHAGAENANSAIFSGGIIIMIATPDETDETGLLAGQPTFEIGTSAVRIEENTVRVALGQALLVIGIGPMAIQNNHLTTGGLITNSTAQVAQTALILNLGAGIDFLDLENQLPSDLLVKSQNNATTFGNQGAPALSSVSNGTVQFTNNICQLEARASAATELSSVLIFSTDSVVFANNSTWLDAASLSAFTDVLIAASTLHVTGNRLQECIGAVLLSAITLGLANITSQNICSNCLLAFGFISYKGGNLVLLDLAGGASDKGNYCTRAFEQYGLPPSWLVPGT